MQYQKTPDNSYDIFSNFENKVHKSTSWTSTHLSPIYGIWHRDEDNMEKELFFKFVKETVYFFKLSLKLI